MKRRLSIALAALLIVTVVLVIAFGGEDETSVEASEVTTIRGVIGSEKLAFFNDERVRQVLAENGLRVEVDAAGSRQIATMDLGKYAFAFPSSSPAAQRIQRNLKITTVYTPFQSPMAVATFTPIVDLLSAAGAVRKGPGEYQVIDVAKYLELATAGTRWDQLSGNTAFPARKNILMNTTDPRESNSAAMYLSLTTFVANGNNVVSSPEAEAVVTPRISRLFLDQGYTQNSTEGPFEDYLAAGMGKAPLALVYESQYLDRLIRADGSIRPGMRLLYPAPTVFSKHSLVPLSRDGDKLGQLLATNPRLGELAATFGFRTTDPRHFNKVVADHKVPAPTDLVDVVEPPSFETLERLLDAVAGAY